MVHSIWIATKLFYPSQRSCMNGEPPGLRGHGAQTALLQCLSDGLEPPWFLAISAAALQSPSGFLSLLKPSRHLSQRSGAL